MQNKKVHVSELVEQEVIVGMSEGYCSTKYTCLKHVPVIYNSVNGVIYVGDTAVQTFKFVDGIFNCSDIVPNGVKATSGYVDHINGFIRLFWNDVVGSTKIKVSYQYNEDVLENMDNLKEVDFAEQLFLLMYHLKMTYSEIKSLNGETRLYFVKRLLEEINR